MHCYLYFYEIHYIDLKNEKKNSRKIIGFVLTLKRLMIFLLVLRS